MKHIHIHIYHQHELGPWLDTLGDWRIREFTHYPYLYDGRLEEERNFARSFSKTRQACIAVATDAEGQTVGICTASQLASDLHGFQDKGIDPASCFYIGEVIVSPEYRGTGLGRQFMERMEREASQLAYTHSCFLCVLRPPNHPLRPKDYRDLSPLWSHLGYHRVHLKAYFKWRTWNTDGTSEPQENTVEYWIKYLHK